MSGRLERLLTLLIAVILITESNGFHYDTIVVGLGSAGATAASTLAKAVRSVLALEAEGRIGGRVKTVPFGDGVAEEGAEWIHGTHSNRVYDLAVQNNISTIQQNFNLEVFSSDGVDTNKELIRELNSFCLKAAAEPPKIPETVGSYVTKRLKEYLKEKYPKVLDDQEFVDGFLEMVNRLMIITDAANDWNDITTASNYKDMNEFTNVSWHRHGYKTFFELLLDTYHDGPGISNLTIKLNKEVTLIKWPQNETGDVEVVCKDGDRYTASNVIVTVSLGVLKERYLTLFSPKLPENKITAIKKMSMGVVGKITLSFAEPWWNITTPFQIFWTKSDKDQLAEDEKWLAKIMSGHIPAGSGNTITLWTSGDVTKLVETLPEDVVKNKSMKLLRKVLGTKYTITEPTGLLQSKWFSNPFTRGTYTYDNQLILQYPNIRNTLAEPLLDAAGTPKVLFAGEATDFHHFGTVHGASDTGYREAMRLLASATE